MKGVGVILFAAVSISIANCQTSGFLNVPFVYEWANTGDWLDSANCGPTSVLMIASYYANATPTATQINQMDDWLHSQFVNNPYYPYAINNYNGSGTNTIELQALASGFFGLTDSTAYSHWTVPQLQQELAEGHPVVVDVATWMMTHQKYYEHYMVLLGMDSQRVYVNDPGRVYGSHVSYPLNSFLAAWAWHSDRVLVIHPNQAITPPRATGLDSGPWPTQGHDNQRTSQSEFAGPVTPGTPTILYDAGSPIGLNQIVSTSDGKLLLAYPMTGRGACTDKLVALNTNGQPLGTPWPYQLMATAYPASPETPVGITVASNGTIYVATHECPDIPGAVPTHLYSISSNGTNTPNWPIASHAMYYSAAIGSDGTIYQMDEFNQIHAYTPEGSLLWTAGVPNFSQGDIALDHAGNLYIGTDAPLVGGHAIYSFTASGAARAGWPQDTGGVPAPTTAVIGPDNQVYIANENGSLFGFNSDGSSIPGFPFNAGGSVSQQPLAISATGTIYMKTSLGLFAIKPDGTPAWAGPFSPGGDASSSPGPAVDANGFIYVAFGDSVYSLNPDGTIRDGWPVTVPSAGSIIIGGNHLLYVASGGQKLYSISEGIPAQ